MLRGEEMKGVMKLIITMGGIALICCAILLVLNYGQFGPLEKEQPITNAGTLTWINQTIPAQHIALQLQMPYDNIVINATVPETPNTVVLYKGTVSDDDLNHLRKFESPNLMKDKRSLPSETEAPALAARALELFGGLPNDAVLASIFRSEAYEQKSSGEITARYPKWISVSYNREINGMILTGGDRDGISVDLGENGELLCIRKLWRTIENTGQTVPVIPAQAAIDKMQKGETIHKLQSSNDLFIDSIRLGYYERKKDIRESILEPVWIFKSTTITGVELLVYARQFANFTATPTYGKAPLTVTFTDTSDASPTKWNWDFGDGTTSTVQNPQHTYTTAGSYNVSLRAWNDLGSDTMEKAGYITVRNPASPIASFTATPTSGNAPLAVKFTDLSANGPLAWEWSFFVCDHCNYSRSRLL